MENKQTKQQESWMNDPRLDGMDKNKLEMLQQLANQGSQKGPNDLLPFLMTMTNSNKKNGPQFSRGEISLIIDVVKQNKSPQEQARLDKIVNIMQMMRR